MNDNQPAPPESIQNLCGRCIIHVKNRTGITLDYQSETLSLLDFFIQELLKEEGGGRILPVGDHRRVDVMHLFAPTIGAYFGELVRNLFPCRWRTDKDDPKTWVIEFEHVPLRFNPVGAAAEALAQTDAEDWGCALATTRDLTESLRNRLEAAPPVTEDDFFTLSTRFEVLQIAVDWLRAKNSQKNTPPKNFSEKDYDTLF
jgi:hypothetical protein